MFFNAFHVSIIRLRIEQILNIVFISSYFILEFATLIFNEKDRCFNIQKAVAFTFSLNCGSASLEDPDPDPTFRFSADPHLDPIFHFFGSRFSSK
jgi:hypothetical protein